MRKFKSILIIAAMAMLLSFVIVPTVTQPTSLAATWTPNSCYTVNTTGGIAMRKSASSSATSVGTIPNNTIIYVTKINGTWGYTGYNGKYGYVDLSKAKKENDSPETTVELQKRLEAMMEYYPTGSTWKGSDANSPNSTGYYITNSGSKASGQCFGFTCEVWRTLYGCEMAVSRRASKPWEFASNSNMQLVGELNGSGKTGVKAYTKNDMIKLLKKAKTGDVLQGCSSPTSTHTMIIYAVQDDGCWLYDANRYGQNNEVNSYFFDWETIYYERAYGIGLYRYVNYPPDEPQKITDANAPATKNSSGTQTASFYLTDKITFATDVKNARKITFYICNKKTNKAVYTKTMELGIYSKNTTSFEYSFSSLPDNATEFYVYYVAENSKYKEESKKTEFKLVMPKITISTADSTELNVGKTLQIAYKLSPSNATVAWKSSNTAYATVSSAGVVTAKAEGTVTITATLSYKGNSGTTVKDTASVKIKVKQPNVDVTFNANGGSTPTAKKTVTKTKTYGDLPTPARNGYTFAGWWTAASGGTKITSTSTVTTTNATQTLYAHWTANQYTVKYNAVGGSISTTPKKITFDSTYGTLATATKTGYDFAGWWTKETGGTQITSSTKVTTASDHTVFAHWTPKKYTVSFNANGGAVSPSSMQATYDSVYGELPVPTRVGYTFKGWWTAKTGGTEYKQDSKVTITANQTLYARWTAASYTVTFDVCGGNELKTTQKTVTYGSTYGTLPTPTHPETDKDFMGWYTDYSAGRRITSGTSVSAAQNITLYARWSYDAVTVMLDPQEGSCETESIRVVSYTPYGDLPDPTRRGYTFEGWYPTREDDDPEHPAEKITEATLFTELNPITLYARWKVNIYEITFETNGANDNFNKTTVEYRSLFGGQTGELPVPEKTGYTFTGWYLDDIVITAETVFDYVENVTLSAGWLANEYTLTLDPNGGIPESFSKKVTYGEPYGEFPIPEKNGYNFAGWFTLKKNGIQIFDTTVMQTAGDVTLYAIWTPKILNVYFETMGGTAEYTEKQVTFDGIYSILPKAERTGYTFGGWLDPNGFIVREKAVVNYDGDFTLTAIWTANHYTIKLDENGGSVSTIIKAYDVVYDGSYPQLPTPIKEGSRFIGWKTKDGVHAFSGETVKITESQTLVADWLPLNVNIIFDADGGVLDSYTKQVKYGGIYGELPEPVRVGYTFLGWYDEAGKQVTPSKIIGATVSVTLKALWTPSKHTLFFDPNGGEVSETFRTVYYDSMYGTLPIPKKNGFNFTHWTDADGNAIFADDTVLMETDGTVYANWTPVDYYVSFDSNGSATVIPSRMVTYQTPYGKMPEIERPGYIFNGWFVGEEKITDESIFDHTTNITVFADWTPVEYSITFDPDGGECSFTTDVKTCDEFYRLPQITKTGYEFAGWFDKNGEELIAGSRVLPIEDQYYKVRWIPIEYNIFFSFNGSIDATLTMSVHYGEKIGAISGFPYEGYTFIRWQTANGTRLGPGDVYLSNKDTILYAVATPNKYKVSFETNDGNITADPVTVTYNEPFGTLPELIRRGYVFNGWKTADGEIITAETLMHFAGNIILYADWKEIVSDTDEVFTGSSLVVRGYELLAVVNVALIAVAAIRRRKIKKTKRNDSYEDDDDEQ